MLNTHQKSVMWGKMVRFFIDTLCWRKPVERTWGKASVRHQVEPDAPLVLCPCDFEQAAAQREFQALQAKTKQRSIGFAL